MIVLLLYKLWCYTDDQFYFFVDLVVELVDKGLNV